MKLDIMTINNYEGIAIEIAGQVVGQVLPLVIGIESILPAPCLKLWSKGLVKLKVNRTTVALYIAIIVKLSNRR